MDKQDVSEIKAELRALNNKLDKYHTETTTNKTDIAWLKRGMFGTFFTWIGAVLYTKFGGQ